MVQMTAAALPARRQSSFEDYLASGGGSSLAKAIPVWASAAALEPARFPALLARPGMSEAATASLQEVGRAFSAIPGQVGIEAAAGHVAHVTGSDGSQDWRYNFAGAVGDAVYAGANDLLPPEPVPAAPAPVKTLVVASATAAALSAVVRTLGPELAKTVARLGGAGVLAAVVIGGAVYVLGEHSEAPPATIVGIFPPAASTDDARPAANPEAKPSAITAGLARPGEATLSDARREYILDGGGKDGGGHGAGRNTPENSEFPADWSDDKASQAINDVANDRSSVWTPAYNG